MPNVAVGERPVIGHATDGLSGIPPMAYDANVPVAFVDDRNRIVDD
jgi:hypothetical protein